MPRATRNSRSRAPKISPSGVAVACRDPDGTLWIGTDGGGLAAWRDGAIVPVLTARDGLPSNLVVLPEANASRAPYSSL